MRLSSALVAFSYAALIALLFWFGVWWLAVYFIAYGIFISILIFGRVSLPKSNPRPARKQTVVREVYIDATGTGHMIVEASHHTAVLRDLQMPTGTGAAIIILEREALYDVRLGMSGPYGERDWTESWACANGYTKPIRKKM